MSLDPLLAPLSSLHDDPDSRRAARQVLGAADPGREVERLYPALLEQYILPAALAHLERAGADLGRLTIPAALFRSAAPLNRLLPPPEESLPGRIPLAAIRRGLTTHAALLRRTVHDLLDSAGGGEWLLLFGQAVEAVYPAYARLPRIRHDVDLYTPDLASALRLLECLWDGLGFTLRGWKASYVEDRWVAHLSLFRVSAEGYLLAVDLLAGGRPGWPGWVPPWSHPPLAARARQGAWDGRPVRAPSPEDSLFLLAEKVRHKGRFTLRDFGDAHFLLTAGEGRLDWDYLCGAARRHRVGAPLYVLAREAGRREGRALAPAGVLARLAPGLVERHLLAGLARGERARTRRARLWRPFWFLQHLGARLGKPRSAWRLLRERFRAQDAPLELLARQAAGEGPLPTLVLEHTEVSDAGLALLGRLPQLETLSLGGTAVTDAGLRHLRGLPRLRRLYLFDTAVTDAGLLHLAPLTGLETLSLGRTGVTDAGLVHLKGLPRLRRLYLFNTAVTDAGLEHLAPLTRLETLSLDATAVSDAGLVYLKGLAGLQALHLRYTAVTEAGAEGLRAALPAVKVER